MARKKKRADGRFQSKVFIGQVDGKRKYKYVYAKTQKELEIKVAEVRAKLGAGFNYLAGNDTFGKWAAYWIKMKSSEVSPQRYYIYECRIRNLAPLEDMPISKIRTIDIQELIIECAEKYSVAVLEEIKGTASQIFRYAIDNRVIDYNPASSVRIPENAAKKRSEKRALTEQEQQWIINTPHRARTAAMIMMFAGLRRGEVVPLLWSDIDLKGGTIRVNKSTERNGSGWTVKQGAKSKAGDRCVYIPQILIDYLKGVERSESLLVCPDKDGNMMSLSAWESMWRSYLTELNLRNGDFSHIIGFKKPESRFHPKKVPFVIPHITPHLLRHTFITSMYLAGLDVGTVKEQAGHADIKTTMAIYVHLDSIYKEKQIEKLNEFFGCHLGVSESEKSLNTG